MLTSLRNKTILLLLSLLISLTLILPATAQRSTQPEVSGQITRFTAPQRRGAAKPAFLLHLPGIGGTRGIDRALVDGLLAGGVATRAVAFDWTEDDPGLDALTSLDRNKREAKRIASLILNQRRRQPNVPIVFTSHSGGAGLMAWALEDLPPGVKVDAAVFIAPALSPGYDLSAALKHVKGKVYVLWSGRDKVVLGAGDGDVRHD